MQTAKRMGWMPASAVRRGRGGLSLMVGAHARRRRRRRPRGEAVAGPWRAGGVGTEGDVVVGHRFAVGGERRAPLLLEKDDGDPPHALVHQYRGGLRRK